MLREIGIVLNGFYSGTYLSRYRVNSYKISAKLIFCTLKNRKYIFKRLGLKMFANIKTVVYIVC